MDYREYITGLKELARLQSYEEGLQFAVLICRKLYPEYVKFYEVYGWGNPALLNDAITICQNAIDGQVDTNAVQGLLPAIDEITPHMDDFGSELGSYALNASAAVYETLQFICDKDNTHVYNIATYYSDTIDFKIQEERTLTEDEIANHPHMIEAWNFILDELKPNRK